MSHTPDMRPQDFVIVQAILAVHLPKDCQVFVFGSRAKSPARRGADLDLAVDLGRAMTLQELVSLADSFDVSDLPYKVDVVDLQTAQEPFKSIIMKNAVPFPIS